MQGAGLKSFPATSEYKKIFPSTPGRSAAFGYSTAADGDTIVVGADGFDSSTGVAFVFERNQGGADNWGEVKASRLGLRQLLTLRKVGEHQRRHPRVGRTTPAAVARPTSSSATKAV